MTADERLVLAAARGLGSTRPTRGMYQALPANSPANDPDWMKAQLAAGQSPADIAKTCGCGHDPIHARLKRMGIQPPAPIRKSGLWHNPAWIHERRAAGMLIEEMALLAGCSYATMRTACKAAGLSELTREAKAKRGQAPPAVVESHVSRWWEHKTETVEPCDGLACDPDVDCRRCKRWRG